MAQRLSRYSIEVVREAPAAANADRLSRYSLEVVRVAPGAVVDAFRLSRYSLEVVRGQAAPAASDVEGWGFIPI